jgi:hypothetical protein
MMTAPTLVKQPSESRLYSMDFSGLMAAGEFINGCALTPAHEVTTPALVVGTPVYAGQIAQARASAGKAGTTYKITFVVTTNAGNTLEGEGNLIVREI